MHAAHPNYHQGERLATDDCCQYQIIDPHGIYGQYVVPKRQLHTSVAGQHDRASVFGRSPMERSAWIKCHQQPFIARNPSLSRCRNNSIACTLQLCGSGAVVFERKDGE